LVVNTTCNKDRSLRTSIVEYFQSNIRTAQVLVHEIGHNLGIHHDFKQEKDESTGKVKKVGRLSKEDCTVKGCTDCTTVKGYMDYTPDPSRWSPCSVEDFKFYYDKVVRKTGSYCLQTNYRQASNVEQLGIATTTSTPKPTIKTPKPACMDDRKDCFLDSWGLLCNVKWFSERCLRHCQLC